MTDQMKGNIDYDIIEAQFGNTVLFYIERSMDTQMVVYQANRKNNSLIEPYVDMFWTSSHKPNYREEVGTTAQEVFFGVKVRKVRVGVFQMLVNAMPKKIISIHLRKNGSCIAKTTINNKESRLVKIYAEMSRGAIPTVLRLFVYGIHKNDLVCEQILIDDNMRKQFDVTKFIPLWSGISSVFQK